MYTIPHGGPGVGPPDVTWKVTTKVMHKTLLRPSYALHEGAWVPLCPLVVHRV